MRIDTVATRKLLSQRRISALSAFVAPKAVDLTVALSLLDADEQQAIEQSASGSLGLDVRVLYEGLLRSTPIENLVPEVQACLLRAFLALMPAQAGALTLLGPLLKSSCMRSLSNAQRCTLLLVFVAATDGARLALLIVATRTLTETVWQNGSPMGNAERTFLLDENEAGQTLLADCANEASDALSGDTSASGRLTLLLSEMARPVMVRFGQPYRGLTRDIFTGQAGTDALQCYEQLVSHPTFSSIDTDRQARLLLSLLLLVDAKTFSNDAGLALLQIGGAPAWAGNQDVMAVFDACSDWGRTELVKLALYPEAGTLEDPDAHGNSLLANLGVLSGQLIEPAFAAEGITQQQILDAAVNDAASPGQIEQGHRGTCTVTCMQFMLVQSNPAEYVRLLCGLFAPAGETRLRNGDDLIRVSDSISDDGSDRTVTSRIFQAAMMDYGDDAMIEDDYTNTGSDRGLSKFEQRRALEGLFDVDVHLWGLGFYIHRDPYDVLKDCLPRTTLVDVNWPDPFGRHALAVLRIEDGQVYFRNPTKMAKYPPFTPVKKPDRILVDWGHCIEAMPESEFSDYLEAVYEVD